MFQSARLKLTAWYLAIIMVISLSFSGVIYFGINQELTRIESLQKARIQRIVNDFPAPFEIPSQDIDAISEARVRILSVLGFINLSILIIAGAGGYFLAGITLEPIRRNMEEQKAFIGNASHELRTPLTSLMSEIEVTLRDKKLGLSDARKMLASNLEDVKKMTKLSNYLLELNRFEEGKELPKAKVDLREVVIKAIGRKKVKTNLKKSVVMGNEDSLVELVTILVDNALKYGNGRTVEIRTKVGGKIEVEDHGIGIAKDEIPHIFDRFYRSDKSRGADGYGLGLSIARSIVKYHGGTIEVESKTGKGTTFKVNLS